MRRVRTMGHKQGRKGGDSDRSAARLRRRPWRRQASAGVLGEEERQAGTEVPDGAAPLAMKLANAGFDYEDGRTMPSDFSLAVAPDEMMTLAGIAGAIKAMPQGYDTPYAEGLLSQGQAQLPSIARAVAADPKLLLLDEIAANLDSGTEARAMEALSAPAQPRRAPHLAPTLRPVAPGQAREAVR